MTVTYATIEAELGKTFPTTADGTGPTQAQVTAFIARARDIYNSVVGASADDDVTAEAQLVIDITIYLVERWYTANSAWVSSSADGTTRSKPRFDEIQTRLNIMNMRRVSIS